MYLLLCDYQGQCFVLCDHTVTIECHEQKLSRLTDFSAFKNICYSLNWFSNIFGYFKFKSNEHLNLTNINKIPLVFTCNVLGATIEHLSVYNSLYCIYPNIRWSLVTVFRKIPVQNMLNFVCDRTVTSHISDDELEMAHVQRSVVM